MSTSTVPLVRSTLLARFPEIAAAMSTRMGAEPGADFAFNLGFATGDDETRVERTLRRFCEAAGIAPDELALMEQCHGSEIAVVEEAGVHDGIDAMLTSVPGLALGVRTADCVPVLLYAPAARAVAAIHAGWRGASERIVERTVGVLCEEFGAVADELLVWIGPSARGCCYEVGEDVAALFPETAVTRRGDRRPTLDLATAVREQLRERGLEAANIDVDAPCTVCTPAVFHSHRRDGSRAGRMLAVIALSEAE